jgi:hypothetical protein
VPPPPTAVTTPVELTVATAVLLVLHEPPGLASLSVTVEPWHAVAGPVMAAGIATTVTTVTAGQVVDVSVKVTNAVPADTPVRYPPDSVIVATDVLPLVQVP